jgi:geranylgeranyl reductase family protein
MHNYEIIIAGAGPSGCAAALQLCNLDSDLASRILLLDKAVFPRPKLCAGAVSADGALVLEQLGVDFDVPCAPVHVTRMILPTGCLRFEQPNHFRVVSREQFDNHLFQAAHNRGVVTRDGEAVQDVVRTADEVIVRTSKDEYRAKILIAADGANSTIRARLGLSRIGRIMVGMEIHTPLAGISIPGFVDNTILLDFEPLNKDLPGYCWVFPTVNEGAPVLSLGILAAPFRNGHASSVKEVFADWLTGLGLDLGAFDLKAHPALRYERKASCSQPRVLFVGDAAGLEPLFGEGIASALALGTIAAQFALDALLDNDFSFYNYEKRIRSSRIGSMMRRRHIVAKRIYSSPRLARLLLRHGTMLRGIALLSAAKSNAKITWEPDQIIAENLKNKSSGAVNLKSQS